MQVWLVLTLRSAALAVASVLTLISCQSQFLGAEARSGLAQDPYPTAPSQLAPSLRMLVWPDTILDNVKASFEKRYDVKLEIDTFSNNEEAYQRLTANPLHWDVIMVGQYMADRMRREDLLDPVPRLNSFIYQYIDTSVLNEKADPQMRYFVPFDYAAMGISFNVEHIAGFPRNWNFLLDQEENPKAYGRIALPDDMRYAMATAMLYGGLDPASTDPKTVEKAKTILLDMVRRLGLRFVPDPRIHAELLSREALVAVTWSAEAASILKARSSCRFLIPEGKSITTVDGFSLPKGGKNPETAALFIEYMLHPYVSLLVADQTMYASVNKRSMKHVSRFMINSPSTMIAPPELRTHMAWLQDDERQMYEEAWAEIKRERPDPSKISMLPVE